MEQREKEIHSKSQRKTLNGEQKETDRNTEQRGGRERDTQIGTERKREKNDKNIKEEKK